MHEARSVNSKSREAQLEEWSHSRYYRPWSRALVVLHAYTACSSYVFFLSRFLLIFLQRRERVACVPRYFRRSPQTTTHSCEMYLRILLFHLRTPKSSGMSFLRRCHLCLYISIPRAFTHGTVLAGEPGRLRINQTHYANRVNRPSL